MSQVQQRMGRHMLVVGAGILLSKLLGLTRDIVFAYVWGTSTALAAFILAFTIPNLLRALFGEGAFNAAFVPLFNEKLESGNKSEAWGMASRIMTVGGLVLVILVAAMTGLALLARAVAPNELWRITLSLLPWVLPYGILICLTAGMASILNSLGRFGVPAMVQVVLNVCLVAGALVVAPWFGTTADSQVYALVIAVLVGGVLQFAVCAVACRREGWRFRFLPAWSDPVVRRFGLLLAPIMVGTGVVQLNVVVDRLLAGYLGNVATTTLYYSQRLVYLPVGLFGVAMSTVCLPAMSRAWARDDREGVAASLRFSLDQVLFMAVPSAVALALLRTPVIRLLFERGDFTAASTTETAWTLMFYLVGIPAFAAAKIATTPFHARQDTGTPVRIAGLCLVVNVILNLVLMQFLRQGGLALSTAICSWLNVLLLLYFMRNAIGGPVQLGRLFRPVSKIVAAAALAGCVIFYVRSLPVPVESTDLGRKIYDVFVPAAIGGIVYLLATFLLGCSQFNKFRTMLKQSKPQA